MSTGTQNFSSFATSLPQALGPIKHTQNPSTTGTSVMALVYDGGVMMAADVLGSYGSLARYRNVPRILKVNDETVVGCMGDYADFQYLQAIIEQREIAEMCQDDGFQTTARSLHSWLTRMLYNKRCKFDPLWTTFVVAGVEHDEETETKKAYLGFVDKLGTAYNDGIIATGYGSMIATPMIRKAVEDKKATGGKLTEKEARDLLEDCVKVMYYRDARSSNKFQVANIPLDGRPATIEGPFEVAGDWAIAHYIRGYE